MASAIEAILRKLKLEKLIVKFQEEHVDISVVLSLSDNELMRLGVDTIGDRVRLKELCKEAQSESGEILRASSSQQRESVRVSFL